MSGQSDDSPIDGQVLLVASAKASVVASEMPGLVRKVQGILKERIDTYESRYERVHVDPPDRYYLVPTGHWADIGDDIGLTRREYEAVRRSHEEQLLRVGRRASRQNEFDAALDIREVVVIRADQ